MGSGRGRGLEFWAEEMGVQGQGFTDVRGGQLRWLVEDMRAVSKSLKGYQANKGKGGSRQP